MPKSSLEKALEKYQKVAAKSVKKKIQADKRLADKQRKAANRQAQIDARRESSFYRKWTADCRWVENYYSTVEELISIICGNYRREDSKLTNNDIDIPRDYPKVCVNLQTDVR